MKRLALLFLVVASAPGCKVVDAPERLEELMVFAFTHFDGRRAQAIETQTALEPEADIDWIDLQDGFRIDNLTIEDLEGAGVNDPNVDHIIGAVGGGQYAHGLDDVMFAVTHPQKDEAFDYILAYETKRQDDRQCFLDGECESYTFTATQTASVPVLGQATQTMHGKYRRFELEDGRPFVMGRILTPDPIEFNTNIVAIKQQFSVVSLYPVEGGTRRVEAFWVEAKVIGVDLPDAFAVDQFASGVKKQVERIDAFLDAR